MRTPRVARSLVAVGLLLVALVTLLYAVDAATLTYTLPPVPGSTAPNRHTRLWAPGVVASVLAAVAVAGSTVCLVLALVGRAPHRTWGAYGGLVALAVVVTLVAGGLPQPTF